MLNVTGEFERASWDEEPYDQLGPKAEYELTLH